MGSIGSINVINGGLDVQSIVDQLMQIEHQPVDTMQSKVTDLKNRVTAFQTLNTKVSTLLDKIKSIIYGGDTDPALTPYSFQDRLVQSIFANRKVTSSDDSIVSATSGKGTASGSYAITVSSLAQAMTMASANVADIDTTTLGTGTIVIQGTTGDPVNVTIDSSNNSLAGIRNAINSANAGVTATIINDGSSTPYRLLISANTTGTANAFTITNNLTGGSSALDFTQTQAAADAQFTVNSISITKSTNTIDDVIDGVTLDLKALTTSPVTRTVTDDIDSIVKAMQDFASAYNDLNTFIGSQFSYNSTTKSAGVLSGDFTLRQVQSWLQGVLIQSPSNQYTSYGVISQIGLNLNRDGSLSVDETKLRDALSSDFKGVAGLLLGDGEGDGVASCLSTALDGITDPLEGPIHNATDSLNRNISDLNDQISAYEDRLDVRRQQLMDEYSRADQALRLMNVAMASLTSQTSSLSSIK